MVAIEASAQDNKCRDKELEVACKTAIEAADELIKQKDAKSIYLEEMLRVQLTQFEAQSKLLVAVTNPPWYRDPKYTFLLGIITGGVTYEIIRSNR